MHNEYKSQLLAQGLPIGHRDMIINGGNLPESPLPNTVPLAAVHSDLIEVATELQTFVADLLASLEGSPAPFTLADFAGDIRGNACHLWNLLVAVNDNNGEETWDGITTVCPYCSTDALRPAREDGCSVCYTDSCNCHACSECGATLSDPTPEDGEISTAFDPCVKCGEVAPLDIHGICIACELPHQFGKGI